MTAPEVATAGAQLAAEAARLAGFGWMRATSGNLSVVLRRDPVRLVVTASGLDKGELTAEDVVVVDGAGQPADGERGTPSAEAALHARITVLTGAGAVLHAHPVAAVVVASRWPDGIELGPAEMLKALGRGAEERGVTIPVIANDQDMRVLGARFTERHDPTVPAVVVADHGVYAWGGSLLGARHHLEAVVWLLESVLASAHLGLSQPTRPQPTRSSP